MVSPSNARRYALVAASTVLIAALAVAIASAGLPSVTAEQVATTAQHRPTAPGVVPGAGGVDVPGTGEGRNGGLQSIDRGASLVTPGAVAGFVFGTLLSVALVLGGSRLRDRVGTGAFTGRARAEAGPDSRVEGSDSPDDQTSDETAGGPSPTPPAADGEFLTDEARVKRLLETRRGRMKQSAIVEMTEWSKSKVSRVLSRMAENGEVLKIVLGRENLICLPGHEPDIVKPAVEG